MSRLISFQVGLRAKLMLLTGALLSLVVLFLVWLVSQRLQELIVAENRSRGVAIAQLFGATNVNHLKAYQFLPVQQNALLAKDENQLGYLIVYDKEGWIVAHTADLQALFTYPDDPEFQKYSTSSSIVFRERDAPLFLKSKEDRYFEIFLPVTAPESAKQWGLVRLGISTAPTKAMLRRTQVHLYGLGVLSLAFGLALAASLAARITTPIQKLAAASLQAARGDLSAHIQVTSGDELETLAANFNYMILQIKTHQEARIRAERAAAIGGLVNRIVHDCRTPLTVIKGYATFLLDVPLPYDKSRDCLRVIILEVERLERMIDEILEFPVTGKSTMKFEVTLVDEFLRDCCIEIKVLLQSSSIELEQDLRSPVQVLIDPDKMRRALLNLVANAREAIQGTGTIRISSEIRDSKALIEVSDNGAGIPLDMQSKLFEPFFTHGKSNGHGLGMSTTKNIIESHSGSIHFDSLPGRGTTFFISLPIPANTARVDKSFHAGQSG